MFVPLNRVSFLTRLFLLVVSPALLALPSCASDGPPIIRANTNPKPTPLVQWPTPTGEVEFDATKRVHDHFDGKMQRFYGVEDLGTSGQD
jgi:hypothetical protein